MNIDYFHYRQNKFFVDEVALEDIAEQYGTPCYIYSRKAFERNWHAFQDAFAGKPHMICYAVKANSNIAILNCLARLGSGFDIVSIGELQRVLVAGGKPENIVFSGVCKRKEEILAALKVGIRCFNIEVSGELDLINQLAGQLGVVAPISFRVNPDVDANTHPYISTGLKENKFGIDIDQAQTEFLRASQMQNVKIVGVDCHIGSQLVEIRPFIDALDRVLVLVDALQDLGIHLHHLDLGGGLGICYKDEQPPLPAEYIAAIYHKLAGRNIEILLEPGRSIIGDAGVLLTRVEYLKSTGYKNFAIVDAAMNDLLRPALYKAWQEIIPADIGKQNQPEIWDVVGPVCETGDFLGKDRLLSISAGDLLVVRSAGAYGFSMSSNYNSRPRATEVLVDGQKSYQIRARETVEELWSNEQFLP
jgi:diaminopimelate decarboxylase